MNFVHFRAGTIDQDASPVSPTLPRWAFALRLIDDRVDALKLVGRPRAHAFAGRRTRAHDLRS